MRSKQHPDKKLNSKNLRKKLICVGVLACLQTASYSQDLKGTLEDLLKNHPRLVASGHDLKSASEKVSEVTRRAWTPNLDVTSEEGRQKYKQAEERNQVLDTARNSIRATQLLWDFDKSDKQIAEAQAVREQSRATAAATETGLLLEALTAHWSYIRADRTLMFARQSEASVRTQANMESSMVELGKGYESNVLQAKVQLTQAESRRLRSEGALDIAQARVKAVFGPMTVRVDYKMLAVPRMDIMPKTLEEAHQIAQQNNKQIQIGMHRSQAILQRMGSTSAREFLPRINFVTEVANRKNTDGTDTKSEFWNDKKAFFQFQYNLNSGMAGSAAVDAVANDYKASVSREVESRDLVMEQVNIAWRNMHVSMQNKETLANLVRIAAKYYEMAVAERQMGRRTLLEVLSAELSLINALSDLMATEADAAIASLTLLQAIGKLDVSAFELKPIDSVLPKI